jgi:hypothetical protein
MITYANQFVDTVQDTKTKFLKTMITDEKVRAPLQSFVDAQTVFTKEMVKVADSLFTHFSSQAEKFTVKK